MVHRKKRGKSSTCREDLPIEERQKQWNIDLANRALTTLFGTVQIDKDTLVEKYHTKINMKNYTPKELFEVGRDYFDNIVKTNEEGVSIIPDIEDFCLFANISRQRFMSYRTSDNAEMNEIANNIANAIANCKKQIALQGTMNPTIFAIDMNNNHGYVQAKTELTVNQNVSMQQIESNVEDIANRLPMD